MSSNDEPGTIPRLATFQLGEVPHGEVVLLLAYATKQEKPFSRELESFVIGMSRDQATLLADALTRLASAPPSGRSPQQRH